MSHAVLVHELSLDKGERTPTDESEPVSVEKQVNVFNLTESTPTKENPEMSEKFSDEEEHQQISLKQRAFAEQKEQQASQH